MGVVVTSVYSQLVRQQNFIVVIKHKHHNTFGDCALSKPTGGALALSRSY